MSSLSPPDEMATLSSAALLGGAIGVLDHAPVAAPRETFGKRLRVLHVINGEHYAGAERVQDLLALRLPDEGFDVGFACLKPGRFAAARCSQMSPLHVLPMRSRLDLRPVLAMARLVKEGGYDIIHTHTSRSALLGSLAAKMSGAALVHHIHSAATPDTLRDLRDGISAVVERFGFRRADAVIAVSQGIAAYARRGGVRDDRLTIVPNGVPAVDQLSDKCMPTGPWTVGTVALFRERKGLEVLLEAAARGRTQGLPLRLRIVGPFETTVYEERMHKLAEDLGLAGAVEWRGFREDVSSELAAMDLFVMPSVLREGLPMVILEAMANGVPIIGSGVEGIPEVIRDGQDGLIVEPGNPDDLAAAIGRLVRGEENAQALRESAYERQVTRYSDRSMAAGVAAVYAEVLARKQTLVTA
ncbi:MAG TPA: glycosyltransferase family 4 protein [Pirellulales bacterium]